MYMYDIVYLYTNTCKAYAYMYNCINEHELKISCNLCLIRILRGLSTYSSNRVYMHVYNYTYTNVQYMYNYILGFIYLLYVLHIHRGSIKCKPNFNYQFLIL